MNLETYLNNAVAASRKQSLSNSDQLTLGEMILKLEPIVKTHSKDDDEPTVRYDFEYLRPTTIDSWRGAYEELALNFTPEGAEMKVSDFLSMLKSTIGKEFTGYKGGEYVMNKHTPVWVANYGNSGNTAVIDIIDCDYFVMIVTGYRQY